MCVPGGEQELVKIFTSWQVLASWQVLGAVFGELAFLDNLYIKCYNKYNDDNKNVICHQSPKFALYGAFAISAIISL